MAMTERHFMSKPMITQDDLKTTEIKAALAAAGNKLTDEQVLAIQEFIARVGGVDKANSAIKTLGKIQKAAAA